MGSNSSRRWIALIAIVAVLGNSFVPAISHARGVPGGLSPLAVDANAVESMGVICGQGGRSQAPHSGHLTSEHCAYCTSNGNLLAIPVLPASGLFASGGPDLLTVRYTRVALRPLSWTVAQARAPPSLS